MKQTFWWSSVKKRGVRTARLSPYTATGSRYGRAGSALTGVDAIELDLRPAKEAN